MIYISFVDYIGFRLHFQCNFNKENLFRNNFTTYIYINVLVITSSFETMQYRNQHLRNEMVHYKFRLNNLEENATNITLLIHTLNRKLYQHMTEVKTYKLGRLLQHTHQSLNIFLKSVAIPKDLTLYDDERSAISK